jgi:uncharacterized protein YjbI with pentapeptide repeats
MSDGDSSKRPAPEGFSSWLAYWEAKGMPWRTEPEIEQERQQYLAERRTVAVDIETGIYPFRDKDGSLQLTRADVEWLLATHERGNMQGPVDWNVEKQRLTEGLDLRGADLCRVDLRNLPLARLRGSLRLDERLTTNTRQDAAAKVQLEECNLRETHLEGAVLEGVQLQQAILIGAHLESARLIGAHLEGTDLREAHLEGADLSRAHFEGAFLYLTHLEGANLKGAFFNATSTIWKIRLSGPSYGSAFLSDVVWGDVNLGGVRWADVPVLGDELYALRSDVVPPDYALLGGMTSDDLLESATRANRRLATTLRAQGISEWADHFAYRAHVLQRYLYWRERRLLPYAGSLFLDLVSGYGYRPGRSILAYMLVVAVFAGTYLMLGTSGGHPLTWYESLVVSLTAFHGRGFFATQYSPGDPQSLIAAFEAVIGLLIEITFIATFTQRFFAR